MRVLALCGSLRAAARLTPAGMQLRPWSGIGDLPLFKPDLEPQLPQRVAALHAEVAAADALLIASPEYAHGVSGSIKNALDWLVGSETFINKPVAVLNASPRTRHADAALRETLRTMSAVIVEAASISIPLLGADLTDAGMAASASVSGAIRGALADLQRAVLALQSA